ncbi:MAG: family 43 glycosylhydrolase, partial [Armatimonadota bacterium]
MRVFRTIPALVLLVSSMSYAGELSYRDIDVRNQAIQESLVPIRPGIPGERPFWNESSRRFIHVPAFDFKPVEGAKSYLFTATSVYGQTERKFEANTPNAALTPIWRDLPIGSVRLKCEALDAKGGKVIGLAGERSFEKGATFSGPYYRPEISFGQSAELALKGTFRQSYVRYWLRHGKPDPSFTMYIYPSKVIGAVVSGAAAYAQLKPRPRDTDEVLRIGRAAADYLIACSLPEGSPLEHFPLTYQGKQGANVKHADENRIMMIYPAEAGQAYLDLYDVVKDRKYLDAARSIANTYVKTQLPNGAWHLFADTGTGKSLIATDCIPVAQILFLDRLSTHYRVAGLNGTIKKAVSYVLEGPMKTYDWHGQFEDVDPDQGPYKNLSRQEVCLFAAYLLDHSKERREWRAQAEELLAFAEDQFAMWQVAPEYMREDRAKPANLNTDRAFWITPSVMEQYAFYVPISRSMTLLLDAYMKAHQVTGKQIYLEKAMALASALTVGQKLAMSSVNGQYPTCYRAITKNGRATRDNKGAAGWINCTVYPAKSMLGFGEYLKKIRVSEASDPALPNADAVLKSLTLKIPDPPIDPVSGRRSTSDIRKQALQESLVAIRPGIPGKQPFWNEFSRRFVYAPAFDFKAVEGAKSYLFTATSVYEKSTHKFEADSPNAPLTPLWLQIPVGHVVLKCEGLDAPGGKVIGTAVERKFEKAASFEGPYYRPAMGYKESGELALKGMFKQGYIRYWLEHGKPDPSFAHYFYPAKVIGAVIAGSVVYSRIEPKPVDADEALKIGRIAADYLIAQSWPAGTRYEYFPPTYHNAAKRLPDDEIMTIYPAEAAEAYLDLYDVTRDEKYLSAAKKIANTYVKTQGPEGTWPLTVARDTGEPRCKTLCIPTAVVHFMERLKLHYEVKGLEGAISKAVKYTRDEPMRSFDWHGQFEDMHRDGPPYRNMARQEVCQMAAYLFDHAKENPAGVAQAEELLAYAEDQFVVWRVAPEYLDGRLKPGSPGVKNDQTNWITPSVLEQYGFYVPICRSMGMLLTAYQTAHRVTGKRIYLEKGKALADALTVGQKAFLDKVDGQFPTLFSTKGETDYPAKWINNAVYPAKYLLEFGEYLKTIGVPETSDLALLNAEAVLKSLTVEMSTLPKVLILGDSISIGYTQPTRKKLIGKAEVSRPRGNCQSTDFALKHIKEWLGTEKWNVIHFNWGIWDMHHLSDGRVRTSPEQYERNLRELLAILKSTGAKLIWATTTPVGQRLPVGYTVNGEDVPVYNAVAAKVMRENGVAIDDLYSAVLPEVGKLRNEDATHYKPEGYEFLASRVAESIETALSSKSPKKSKETQNLKETSKGQSVISYSPAKGIGLQEGVMRRDPSDIIKVNDLYYVWYSKGAVGHGYDATVWYATSPDGHNWTEKGEGLPRGSKGGWDEQSVFTPNILVAGGKYWLFYTGVPKPFIGGRGNQVTKTAIGVAVADSPDGPWQKLDTNPVLKTSEDTNLFDSMRVDDACMLVRDGKYWLYYKGRQWDRPFQETKMGVAIAEKPEGPYVKHSGNPVVKG